jgi:hypothetical protein
MAFYYTNLSAEGKRRRSLETEQKSYSDLIFEQIDEAVYQMNGIEKSKSDEILT